MATAAEKRVFLEQMTPLAQKYGMQAGIDPNLIISQAALETGYGKSAPNNNYFGIKGPGGLQTTREFIDGRWVTISDSFRGYSSMEDSVKGYTDFLRSNPRYGDVFGKTGAAAAEAVHSAGYATDPQYSSKLKSIINSISTKDVVNGVKAVAQAATGDVVGAATRVLGIKNPLNSIGDKALDVVGLGSEGGISKFFEWLKELFSANTAARAVAILVGLLLIAGAIWALLNADTIINNVSNVAKTAAKAA
jgi:hypothetical protein